MDNPLFLNSRISPRGFLLFIVGCAVGAVALLSAAKLADAACTTRDLRGVYHATVNAAPSLKPLRDQATGRITPDQLEEDLVGPGVIVPSLLFCQIHLGTGGGVIPRSSKCWFVEEGLNLRAPAPLVVRGSFSATPMLSGCIVQGQGGVSDPSGAGESILYWVPAATLDNADITGAIVHRLDRPGPSVEDAHGTFMAIRVR